MNISCYRQKTKSKAKEQFTKLKIEQDLHEVIQNKTPTQVPTQMGKMPSSANGSKINILQNINLPPQHPIIPEDHLEQIQEVNNSNMSKQNEMNHLTTSSFTINDNINNKLKLLTKSNNVMFKPLNTNTNLNMDLQKTLKMCTSRKPIPKTVPTTNQKLIVVSNTQTMPNSSILQRTLTIPFVKNISVKNFDKFKIVSTSGTPVNLGNSTVNTNSFNSVKHKVVTVRTSNPASIGKKVLPVTQLQMLNKGSIKVLPLGGKIVGKTTTTSIPSSMYIMNSMGNIQNLTKTINSIPIATPAKLTENIDNPQIVSINSEASGSNGSINVEKPKQPATNCFSSSKPVAVSSEDDYDSKINEFHIHTIQLDSEDAVVEVKSEEDEKIDVTENDEIDQTETVCMPEMGKFAFNILFNEVFIKGKIRISIQGVPEQHRQHTAIYSQDKINRISGRKLGRMFLSYNSSKMVIFSISICVYRLY